jgi:capsule polysaccharide export protein KpsE/RkpR
MDALNSEVQSLNTQLVTANAVNAAHETAIVTLNARIDVLNTSLAGRSQELTDARSKSPGRRRSMLASSPT